MDIDQQRLDTVGGFIQRIVQASGAPFRVHLSGAQREAIDGSTYVITQLRVGQMKARRADEYLGYRNGLIGQETTGGGWDGKSTAHDTCHHRNCPGYSGIRGKKRCSPGKFHQSSRFGHPGTAPICSRCQCGRGLQRCSDCEDGNHRAIGKTSLGKVLIPCLQDSTPLV